MSAMIYYFTGTGNSLAVARDIARGLKDSQLIPITQENIPPLPKDATVLGIVYPVYAWGPPKIVDRFVKQLQRTPQLQYCFSVVTAGGDAGGCHRRMGKALHKQGIRLDAAFTVLMPSNYIHSVDIEPDTEMQDKWDQWAEDQHKVIDAVRFRQPVDYRRVGFKGRMLTGLIHPMASMAFPQWGGKFYVNEHCNGCGICVKVCPVANIAMEGDRPRWETRCQQCLACLHACPQQAVQSSETTPGRKRYIHPDITLQDLMKR